MATDADTLTALRELADSLRDLATAQDHARLDREAMRGEGQLRGEIVVNEVKAHHAATMAELRAMKEAVDELRRTKAGAPWAFVYFGVAFNALLTIFIVAIYVNSNGDDAAAAAKIATDLVPEIPGLPADDGGGTTPVEPEHE